jgi:hypothetical protein
LTGLRGKSLRPELRRGAERNARGLKRVDRGVRGSTKLLILLNLLLNLVRQILDGLLDVVQLLRDDLKQELQLLELLLLKIFELLQLLQLLRNELQQLHELLRRDWRAERAYALRPE